MKTSAQLTELRAKDIPALQTELDSLLKAHFNLRMQKGTQQLQNTCQLGNTKRAIARVRTLIQEKKAKG
ncbi:50S ribosomal subunit protein L29 [Thiomonas arsenitoxydans]|uniref:Large ribosomal subunit protein uL29 n=2 Tax=Thiomonas TaxID=32012 RepID=D6CN91_THIA3|nr:MULTISPECIES: 50S ribosomal protein L29 [Thiomonas]MDE1977747.1 50S ribosomal protein L29 [Betaproteobacteria bacterium]OYV31055.1 MAG: 50S ribosomal protein L29 [Thiomonas sp. 20-64-9]OZB51976.1 MAG: 50S ribosomal protein L29 [Thiomonas sp. 15-63-373]OZB72875.1 MAG: 50S ribosomal protein L29 [Thiomonas sp. 14-64-326]CQR43205.1 50S ribosomal subunit protein L29 [Thiomonas sp. CB3]